MKKVEEEHVDRSKGAHQAAEHTKEQCKIKMQPLGIGIHSVKPCGETDSSREQEKRHGDAVKPEVQVDTDTFQTSRQAQFEVVFPSERRLKETVKQESDDKRAAKSEGGDCAQGDSVKACAEEQHYTCGKWRQNCDEQEN